MQTENSSEPTQEEINTVYQQILTIDRTYRALFVPDARQGRLWTLQTFQKALDGAGLKTELIGEKEGRPRKPQIGDYLLLVEDRFLLDIAHKRKLSLQTDKSSHRIPPELLGKIWIIFNFGSHRPQHTSPYHEGADEQASLNFWLDKREDLVDDLGFLLDDDDDDYDPDQDELDDLELDENA